MKSKHRWETFSGIKRMAIVGVKGLPPEFAGTSGVEFYVAERLRPLHDLGIRVTCYVRPWATPENERRYLYANIVRVPSIRTKYLDAISHSLLSTVAVCFSAVDAVWFHATGPALFSFVPRLFGKKVIVTVHTLEWKREKWGVFAKALLRFSERIAARCAHRLFVVSDDLSRYFFREYGVQATVDEPTMKSLPRIPPNIISRKYGFHGDDYVLYMGRFVPEKRIDWLIRAFQHLRPKNVALVIAGGDGQDAPYERLLRSLANGNRHIRFTGWVFGKEKTELLGNCRLFVLPSSIEGNPIVLHELSETVPIVTSQSVTAAIRSGRRVYSFINDSETDFVRTMRQLLGSA